jgi:ribosomal-protein-serine acetyltransferase
MEFSKILRAIAMFEHNIDANLMLRMLREDDAEELFRVVDANRLHLRQWLPWLDANTEVGHTRQFIKSTVDQHARNEGFVCAILLSGRIVGVVGYHPIKWANRSVEIGYWLSRDAVGQGIVTRCCRVLIDHAFSQLGLNRVAIPVAVGNARSRAIPERLGFAREGVVRDAEWLYDHYVDHVLYAVLKRDWNS